MSRGRCAMGSCGPRSRGCGRRTYEVYGADKVRLALNRQGISTARCTVERLMRDLGLQGARRGRKVRTTVPGKDGQRAETCWGGTPPPRRRTAAGWPTSPMSLPGAGSSTSLSSWTFTRKKKKATHKRAKLVLDALEMALWRRDRDGRSAGPGLVHHSDAGSQYTRPAYGPEFALRVGLNLVDASLVRYPL